MNLRIVYACSVLIVIAPIIVLASGRNESTSRPWLDWYFRIRSWETAHDCVIPRVLGVRMFTLLLALWYKRVLFAAHRIIGVRLLRQPPLSADQWRRLIRGRLPAGPNRRAWLASLRRNSTRYELIHLSMLAPSLPVIACFAAADRWIAAAAFAGLTWVMNIWPILFQRYTRARIESSLG